MARVTAPDLELWLTGYVRGVLAAEGVTAQVSNKEPGDLVLPLAKPLVVICLRFWTKRALRPA